MSNFSKKKTGQMSDDELKAEITKVITSINDTAPNMYSIRAAALWLEYSERDKRSMDVKSSSDLGEDVVVVGDPDTFKLISKASGKNWMRSTKAMQVHGGCVVNTSHINDGHIAEALTFVPNVYIVEQCDGSHSLVDWPDYNIKQESI